MKPPFPTQVAFDDARRTIVTEWAGEPLDASNAPEDVVAQTEAILGRLSAAKCRHNDIKPEDLLVRDGRVVLADYGWASPLDAPVPRSWRERVPDLGKPTDGLRCPGLYEDRCALENVLARIAPAAVGVRPEVHVLVDWTSHYGRPFLTTAIERAGLVVLEARTLDPVGHARLREFYGGVPIPVDDVRATGRSTAYVLRDDSPVYALRLETTKGARRVLAKLYDLKRRLRASASGYVPIHATDTIQETKDNLRALGIPREPQPPFADVAAALRALDATPGLRYVVLRHADQVLDARRLLAAGVDVDVDVLVSDYFKAKAALDAESASTTDRYDDGGRDVQNYVNVAGTRVKFDIKCVGDGYFDATWQGDVLADRVLNARGFYEPSDEHRIHTILYHALLQKPRVLREATDHLPRDHPVDFFRSNYGLDFTSVEDASSALVHFMKQRGYRVQPDHGHQATVSVG